MSQPPPTKRVKHEFGHESRDEFVPLINECYDLKFNTGLPRSTEDDERLQDGMSKIRGTLENCLSSSDVTFGSSKTSAKINWAKCLGLLLEDGPFGLSALKILTERLSPGGGLL